ncbi:hypothetical protein GHT06_008796 [Daphnia sinensis]|uniref:Uncharacterized protein n=1 Tax=Daphnia sinensis TaxID=1820382 RepID=A0AAD5Q2L7_9CRUS|nr:hypothetical protein GHT06_008796 [Daphnia sinensis]
MKLGRRIKNSVVKHNTISKRKIIFEINFIIVDVLLIQVVEKPGFQALVSSLAPHLKIRSRTFFTGMLVKKYHEKQQQLKNALFNCTDAASNIDAWKCRRRSSLGETIHWYDSKSLKKKSAYLAVRRIYGHHTYDVLAKMKEAIHSEYQVKEKLRGSTTDNGSNFLMCFREKGASSSLPNYDDIIDEEFEEHLLEEEAEEDMLYFEIGNVLTDPPLNTTQQ